MAISTYQNNFDKKLHTSLDASSDCKIKFIDLFAGMGGMRLGFEKAFQSVGFKTECVLTSEIKSHAVQALNHNFSHNLLVGDITKIDADSIPDFDFLLGGFPCQAFSFAGKGLGFLDTRGTLFFDVERILRAKKPYGFILENVEGLVHHDRVGKSTIGRTLSVILQSLENLGYQVTWRVLDSQEFGVAQSRRRIYIIGTLDTSISLEKFEQSKTAFGQIMEHNLPVLDSQFTRTLLQKFTPSQLYGKSIKDKRGGTNNIHSWDLELKGSLTSNQKHLLELLMKQRRKKIWSQQIGIEWMDGVPLTVDQIKSFYTDMFDQNLNLQGMLDDLVMKGYLTYEHPKSKVKVTIGENQSVFQRVQDISKPKGYNIVAGKLSFEFSKILSPNEVAPTLVAMDVDTIGVIDNDGIRRLSMREGLRLCGYPEDYDLSFFQQTKGYKLAFDLLGNTVIVPVIESIATRIAKHMLVKQQDVELSVK